MWKFCAEIEDQFEQRLFVKWIQRTESADRMAAMVRLAQSEASIAVAADKLDADPWLLNTKSGTVNLKTGELLTHDPKHLITKICGCEYDPNMLTPIWDAFLNRIMDGNESLIAYLQRVAGLCCTAIGSVQELWILHGIGANGKSTFTDTLTGILGEYAVTAPESLLIARQHSEHSTELAGLMGSRAVFGSEIEGGVAWRLQLIKRLTGDAMIRARFMRQDFFEFARTFKLLVSTNNKPQVSEQTEAAWRRLRLIPFTVVIPEAERDTNLSAKLRDEWPGILAWCVRGCLDWQANGMKPPAEVLAATETYRAESDPLADFIADRLVLGAECKVSRGDIWMTFQSWQNTVGDKLQIDRNELFARLRKLAGVGDAEWKFAGQKVRGFKGVGILTTSNHATEGSDCE